MPNVTTHGHIFPAFGRSLISIPVLADANLNTTFTQRGVFVTADTGDPEPSDVIIHGGRDSKGLFELPLVYDAATADSNVLKVDVAIASLANTVTSEQPLPMGPTNQLYADLLGGHEPECLLFSTDSGIAKSSIRVQRSVAQLMQFYGKSLGNQPDATILAAIDDGLLDTFPGLSATRWRQHPPDSIDTAKGHLDKLRKNTARTTPKSCNPA
jgi:hypothetical protein